MTLNIYLSLLERNKLPTQFSDKPQKTPEYLKPKNDQFYELLASYPIDKYVFTDGSRTAPSKIGAGITKFQIDRKVYAGAFGHLKKIKQPLTCKYILSCKDSIP